MNLCFTVSLKWSFLIHLISFSLRLSLSYLAILILLIDVLLQTFAYYFLPISFLTELVFSCYYLSFFSIFLLRYPSLLIPPQLQLHIWLYAPLCLRTFARNSFNRSHFNDLVKMSARFTSDGTCDRSINPSSSWWRTHAKRYPIYIDDLLILSFLIPSRLALLSIFTGVGPPCRNPISVRKKRSPNRCFTHSTLAINSESLDDNAGMLWSLLLHPNMFSPYLIKYP